MDGSGAEHTLLPRVETHTACDQTAACKQWRIADRSNGNSRDGILPSLPFGQKRRFKCPLALEADTHTVSQSKARRVLRDSIEHMAMRKGASLLMFSHI